MSTDQDSKQDLVTKAIWDLDTDGVRQLLKNGADVNGRDSKGVSPLEAAVESAFTEMIQLLLDHGADAKAVDSVGRSLLYTWSESTSIGQEKEWTYSHILGLLLSHGAWVTDKDLESEKSNPLSTILEYGGEGAASAVFDTLKKSKTSLTNVLHSAAGNSEGSGTLKFLLKSKQFDINEKNRCGSTPLHVAAQCDHSEQILMLLQHGADPNIVDHDGETPLIITVEEGRPWSIEVLCAYGADINVKTRENKTLLQLASQAEILPFNKCQCIIKQIALLESEGREVNPEYYSEINGSPKYQKYFNKCKKEIELAKKTIIDQSITYYKILTDQESNLYAKNKKVLTALKSKSFVDRFDVYGQRICMHFIKVRPDQKKLFKLFEEKNMSMALQENGEECIIS